MYTTHEHLEIVPDKTVLWKYVDFLKFAYLIETKTLWFNRIDKFKDVYEGTYPHANTVLRPEVYGKGNVIPEATYATMENYGRSRMYVSCFHADSFESAAMWSLYSESGGVAIKTDAARLQNSFKAEKRDIFISPVKYADYDVDFLPEGNVLYLGLYKRMSFSHENEVRCLYLHQEDTPPNEFGYAISVDIPELITAVYISPYAPSYAEETVKLLMQQSGYNIPIIKSKLYEFNR